MPFLPHYVTDQKREVRQTIYGLVGGMLHGKGIPILILPGRTDEEIRLAQSALPGCRITAYDLDPVAVEIARESGADEVERRNIANLPAGRWWEFSNFDSCGVISPDTLACLRNVAARTAYALGVTVTVGRWPLPPVPRTPVPVVKHFHQPTQARVEALQAALADWHLRAALPYRGHRVPMLTTLWTRAKMQPVVGG